MIVMQENLLGQGVSLYHKAFDERTQLVLEDKAVFLLSYLHRKLEEERRALLQTREERKQEFKLGKFPGAKISADSVEVKERSPWKIPPLPGDLLERRVEATLPAHATKRVERVLLGRSKGDEEKGSWILLDLEDFLKPTWKNIMEGIYNIKMVGAKEVPESGRFYVRVRGLHLLESNLRVDGEKISAALLDLVLCAYHTAHQLLAQNKTPHYLIPKCQDAREARWWELLLCLLEEELALPLGSIKITFMIETLTAAYEMEEILQATQNHVAGLRAGQLHKVFGDMKVFHQRGDFILPDMTIGHSFFQEAFQVNFLKYLVNIGHTRGVLCLAEGAPMIPGELAPTRERQKDLVREEVQNFYQLGFDGYACAHPYFREVTLKILQEQNQLIREWPECQHPPAWPDQWPVQRTLQGLREIICLGIAYQHAWNRGSACITRNQALADQNALEFSRAQVWQWIHHQVQLDHGVPVTKELVFQLFDEELQHLLQETAHPSQSEQAEPTLKNEVQLLVDSPETLSKIAEWQMAKEEARELFLCEAWSDYSRPSSELA